MFVIYLSEVNFHVCCSVWQGRVVLVMLLLYLAYVDINSQVFVFW